MVEDESVAVYGAAAPRIIESGGKRDRRLVYQTETGEHYHLKPHHRSYAVTWTQRFAEDGLGLTPCQTCFRGRRPRHRGQLVEVRVGITGALRALDWLTA